MKIRTLLVAAVLSVSLLLPTMTRTANAAAEPQFGAMLSSELNITDIRQAAADKALADIKQQIDILKENGQSWVRVGLPTYNVAGFWGDDMFEQYVWKDDGSERTTTAVITYYQAVVKYAKDQGMNVFLVLADGEGADDTDEEYDARMRAIWDYIAGSLAQYTDVVQIYNEAGGMTPRSYEPVPHDEQPSYWQWLGHMFDIASDVFKSHNENTLITTNTYGWPLSEEVKNEWVAYMDAVAPHLDAVSLDLYADSSADMQIMTDWINLSADRYNKPIFVAEFGRQGYKDGYSNDTSRLIPEQGRMVAEMVQAIRQSKAVAGMLYMLKDSGADDYEGEQNFGIIEYEGTYKASFTPVMNAMRPTAVTDPETPTDPSDPADPSGSTGTDSSDTSANGTSSSSDASTGSGGLAQTGVSYTLITLIALGLTAGGVVMARNYRKKNAL